MHNNLMMTILGGRCYGFLDNIFKINPIEYDEVWIICYSVGGNTGYVYNI